MKSRVLFFGVLAYSSFIMSTASANCSREDVSFYLNKGFTHEQVVQMCGIKPSAATPRATAPTAKTGNNNLYDQIRAPQRSSTTSSPTTLAVQSTSQASDADTRAFLNSAIKAEVSVSPTHIVLTNKNDCIPYGTEDAVGFNNEACVQTRTEINREGLKVVVARKAFAFLGQPEFVVAGKIQRQILNPEVLSKKQLREVSIDYPLTPEQVDIPLHREADVKKLKQTLNGMAL